MGKIKIIAFYLIALLGLILEIIFLFEIPYYRYSNFLKYLKIVRIIFGFLVFLLDIYFRLTSISEIILGLEGKKDRYFQDKNIFYLIDKILIISGFVISLTSLTLNIMGIVSTSDYLSKNNSTDLQNTYSTCSLLLLFENILITICWIYFSIYWGINIHNFRKKAKIKEIDDKKNEQKEEIKIENKKINEVQNIGSDAPLPPRSLQVPIETSSSEREINN